MGMPAKPGVVVAFLMYFRTSLNGVSSGNEIAIGSSSFVRACAVLGEPSQVKTIFLVSSASILLDELMKSTPSPTR